MVSFLSINFEFYNLMNTQANLNLTCMFYEVVEPDYESYVVFVMNIQQRLFYLSSFLFIHNIFLK